MNISNTGRLSAIAAVAILLATASSASAAPAPSPSPSAVVPVVDQLDCLLQRIGTQFVRCDKLTGAGKAAPEWVPEQTGPIEYR